jgi:hypothetical protein
MNREDVDELLERAIRFGERVEIRRNRELGERMQLGERKERRSGERNQAGLVGENKYNGNNRNNGVVSPHVIPMGGTVAMGTTSVVPLVPVPVAELQSSEFIRSLKPMTLYPSLSPDGERSVAVVIEDSALSKRNAAARLIDRRGALSTPTGE